MLSLIEFGKQDMYLTGNPQDLLYRFKLLNICNDYNTSNGLFLLIKYRNQTYYQALFNAIKQTHIITFNVPLNLQKDILNIIKQNASCDYLIKDINNIIFQYYI